MKEAKMLNRWRISWFVRWFESLENAAPLFQRRVAWHASTPDAEPYKFVTALDGMASTWCRTINQPLGIQVTHELKEMINSSSIQLESHLRGKNFSSWKAAEKAALHTNDRPPESIIPHQTPLHQRILICMISVGQNISVDAKLIKECCRYNNLRAEKLKSEMGDHQVGQCCFDVLRTWSAVCCFSS